MFASVYRAMRNIGMPDPRRVDELEMWEIAVLLGADEQDDSTQTKDPHAHLRARAQYETAREAFERGEGPEPDPATKFQWGDPSPEEAELMSVLASGSSFG